MADNQSTYLQTTLVGPGTLSFWWRVSSESGWDYLRFFVDGVSSATPISGETAWAQQTVSIPAGTHVAQWKYAKDDLYSNGSDTGWVDRVVWTGPGPSYGLTVALAGSGTGSVSSSPTGISCGADCTESYASGTVVTLTALADAGSVFAGWSGACSGTAATCQVTMSAARSVTATFDASMDFYTVAPCRVLDSRQAAGPWGGTPLAAGQERTLTLGGACGIPATAQAVSVNITAVDATADGHLRVFPAATPRPTTSVINFRAGQTRANNAVVRLGAAAAVTLFSGQPAGAVHVVVDVNGWFE